MSGKSPAESAYIAFHADRWPGDSPVPWEHPAVSQKAHDAWEAAAKAAITAAGPGFAALETELGKYRGVLERLADEDTWVLDPGLGGGYEEDRHVRANLARQALGRDDVCGCTECQVSLGLEPEEL